LPVWQLCELAQRLAACEQGRVTATPAIKGAEAAQDAARDWQAVHADPAIQYAPVNVTTKPPEMPGWLTDILEAIARALGMSAPVLLWVVGGCVALVVLYALWRLAEPLFERTPKLADEPEDWAPERDQALALLEDADRLAAEGRFDEAAHLLLKRSVAQIAGARPDWIHPASTAREIAAIGALPERARSAFATITARVERSRFALRDLDAADWQAARAAYAEFALERMPVLGAA
jgi:hypothetical protein